MKTSSPSNNIVHFVGIGGIGTSALARWFLSRGYKVSGSDLTSSEITQKLKKEGVKIFIGHKASNLPRNAQMLVRSAALPLLSPEIKEATKLKIPVKTYAEALGGLTRQYETIAIAGAHGKSTSTSILSLILIKAKLDPTVIVGTNLKEFDGTNFRKGKKSLVIEADEYQESFLNYSPAAAMITNIDKEHLDFYSDLATIKDAFLKFIANIKPGGTLVVNKDNKNLYDLKDKIRKIAKDNNLKVFWYGEAVNSSLTRRISASLKIPGDHNVSNALGIYTLAKTLGAKEDDIFSVFKTFNGAWRRMEYRGQLKTKNLKLETNIYDDYAHHPSEIMATLSGMAKKYPKSFLVCVFQPHQVKRLEALFTEFTEAFDDANALILLDIYKVPGRDEVSQNINSLTLKNTIERRLKSLKNVQKKPSRVPFRLQEVIYLPYSDYSPKALKSCLVDLIKNSPLNSANVIMMGAGDIYKMTDHLLK
ncbi:MAG: UDP-N-acetylmuramate--L-alanine ligase [Candidatus Wolfebacteria bacterium]|nr:UDP-N-acetylmuramate--L-alanine ligase [Candidatus Wolfebacteria bacterium]